MVAVGQKILTLQSTDKVKIDVSIPETMVIARSFVDELKGRRRYVVFDSLPKQTFDVAFEEFTSKADDRTQTFTATFSMPAQEKFVILPGMSVTLVVAGGAKKVENAETPLVVPSVAVGADEAGAHFVWKLVKAEKDGEYRVTKQVVEVGRLRGTNYSVNKGLAEGDRIAVAGVSILTEGRVVTLWKE
jgi:RND family efflux transporter MFP subunit